MRHCMRYAFIGLVCAVSTTVLAAPFTNGSFEQGAPLVQDYLNLPQGSTAISAWTVSLRNIDYYGPSTWNAQDGLRSVDLDGSTGVGNDSGALSQTFDTIVGQPYLVNFYLSGNPARNPLIKQVSVSAGNNSQIFNYDIGHTIPIVFPMTLSYAQEQFPFTATSTATTLTFASLTYLTGTSGWGPVIDNVSVTPAPEPASCGVFAVAAMGILGRRRVK